MYKVLLDNRPLWSGDDTKRLVLSPSLNLELNKIGSFSCKILPTHDLYNQFVKLNSIITVLQDDVIIFKGRVFNQSIDFRKIKTVSCEGLLGYFNDSICRPYTYNGSVSDYLNMLINQHNEQVEEHQQFKLGQVTVEDANDYIVRASSDMVSTWQEINNKLIKLLGGYIVIRYEQDGHYIDYLANQVDNSTQDIAFSVNLLDLNIDSSGDGVITCLLPYGSKIEDDESDVETRVDIASVNDGCDYIYDAQAVALYGRIFKVVMWDDVTQPSNLLTKAQEYLSECVKNVSKITVKAIDLHLTNKAIESFKVGDKIKVKSVPHNVDDRMLLTSLSIDLSNPINCTLTLGLEKKGYLESVVYDNQDTILNIKKEISSAVTQVKRENTVYTTTILENANQFTREYAKSYVSQDAFETYKEDTATRYTANIEGFNWEFDRLRELITSDNDNVTKEFEEIKKYIRFVDGNIILGQVDSPLSTKIEAGKISFLYNNVIEVMYIENDKLYIPNAEFINNVIIGNFGYKINDDGSLSFGKVK